MKISGMSMEGLRMTIRELQKELNYKESLILKTKGNPNNMAIVLEYVKIFENLPCKGSYNPEFLSDKPFVLMLVRANGEYLTKVDEKFMGDKEVVLAALKSRLWPEIYPKDISEELQKDASIISIIKSHRALIDGMNMMD